MSAKQTESPLHKIARVIVDKHKALYVLFGIALIYCIASMGTVSLNDDIASYLPDDTETRIGLDIMEEEFTTFGSAQILISNITYDAAEQLSEQIEKIDGVTAIAFENTEEHYKHSSALFGITFDEEEDDPVSERAMEEIKALLDGYDVSIHSAVGYDDVAELAEEMRVILILAVIIIIVVLLFTSRSYMEVPVLLIVFGVAGILNMGTNHFFGEISSITNSIAIILQLALAIDYAIIMIHRYSEERENGLDAQKAAVEALSKALVEISSSSLTTIAGLLALTFMQYRIGLDMGRVLIKGIICSLLTVFLLMPGLLILFSKPIEKTKHKNLVPSIRGWGRLLVKLRYVLPFIFAGLLIAGILFSGQTEYAYSLNSIDTNNPSQQRIAYDKISETFSLDNTIAVLVPTGDYGSEGKILERVEALPEITAATGLANIEIDSDDIKGDYVLTDSLTPRQFSEMSEMDIELVRIPATAIT